MSEDLYPRDKRIVSVTYVTRISFSELNKMCNITDPLMGLIGPSKWRDPRLTRLRKWTDTPVPNATQVEASRDGGRGK